jgi:hypothetical protein
MFRIAYRERKYMRTRNEYLQAFPECKLRVNYKNTHHFQLYHSGTRAHHTVI